MACFRVVKLGGGMDGFRIGCVPNRISNATATTDICWGLLQLIVALYRTHQYRRTCHPECSWPRTVWFCREWPDIMAVAIRALLLTRKEKPPVNQSTSGCNVSTLCPSHNTNIILLFQHCHHTKPYILNFCWNSRTSLKYAKYIEWGRVRYGDFFILFCRKSIHKRTAHSWWYMAPLL
jgi:hypothetical protein